MARGIGSWDKPDYQGHLGLEVQSLSDWSDPQFLEGIAKLFECGVGAPWRPTRWGTTDPATKVIDPDESLVELFGTWATDMPDPKKNNRDLSHRGSTGECPQWWGYFRGSALRAGMPAKKQIQYGRDGDYIKLFIRQDWFDGRPAELDRLGELFVGLCEVTDAWYGYVSPSDLLRQAMDLWQKNKKLGLLGPDLPWMSDHRMSSYLLTDVYWLQFFGPGYVKWWGREAVERLGVRRVWTANGGVVVWACEEPPHAVWSFDRLDQYEWKQSFFESLPAGAVAREGGPVGEPGEFVPTLYDHAEFLGHRVESG